MLGLLLDSTGYRILGVLHILAAVAAFGPLFLYPTLHRNGASATIARLHLTLVLPSLVLVWVFGMGLVGLSDGTVEVSDTWVVLSILGWAGLMAASWFLVRPALGDPSAAARGRLSAGIGITHLVVVVVLVLMIFKPGT